MSALADTLWREDTTRELRCRACERRNRVLLRDAVFDAGRCECGGCGVRLFGAHDAPLTAIAASSYEHPLDRRALAALKALPGFSAMMRWMLKEISERSLRIMFRATCVECGPNQFPELVAMLEHGRRRLDLPYQPTLFLGESPFMNAMTMGVETPLVVVQSALLDQLDDVEGR